MKTQSTRLPASFSTLLMVALAAAFWAAPQLARGQMYVMNSSGASGVISEYNLDGSVLNATLVPASGISFAISGTNLYVLSEVYDSVNATLDGTVSQYGLSGATATLVNPSVIPGLSSVEGFAPCLALSGSSIYIISYAAGNQLLTGAVGEYAMSSGTLVNGSVVTGLNQPQAMIISGTDLFVTSGSDGGGTIGEYTLGGDAVNAALVTGLPIPEGLAISGTNLFVTCFSQANQVGSVGVYGVAGATATAENAALISQSDNTFMVNGIAVSGTNLYLINQAQTGVIGEYSTWGATENASLISEFAGGANYPTNIVVVPPPPTSFTISVPGDSNPFLAGMPAGSTTPGNDVAGDSTSTDPAVLLQSPVLVPGMVFSGTTVLTFAVTGSVSDSGGTPTDPPDGSQILADEAENGISGFVANGDALIGVFLDDTEPDLTDAPGTLDFSGTGNVTGGMNYTVLKPALKQVFFIGDGLTSTGTAQQIVAPTGATRLYLATTDDTSWYLATGSFSVQITSTNAIVGGTGSGIGPGGGGTGTIDPPNGLSVRAANAIKLGTLEKSQGYKAYGRNYSPWSFSTTQTHDVTTPGLALEVQIAVENAPADKPAAADWVDLAPMTLKGGKGTTWIATTSALPVGTTLDTAYFRVAASGTGTMRSYDAAIGPIKVVPGPMLILNDSPESDSDTTGVTAHENEDINYSFTVTNMGNGPADAPTLIAAIPKLTVFADAANTGAFQQLDNHHKPTINPEATESVQWNLGTTLNPGGVATASLGVQIVPAPGAKPTVDFGKTVTLAGANVTAKAESDVDILPPFTTTVSSPLSITVVPSETTAQPGDLITYTLTVTNNSAVPYTSGTVTDRVPAGTFLESIFRADTPGPDGDFNFDLTSPNPYDNINPAVEPFTPGTPSLITWSLPTLAPGESKVLVFAARVLWDIIPTTYSAKSGAGALNIVNNSYTFTGISPLDITIPAFSGSAASIATLLEPGNPANAPIIGFTKYGVPMGAGAGALNDLVYGEVTTVLPNDNIYYELDYWNHGASVASHCVIHEEIADGAEFVGFLSINGVDAVPEQFQYFNAAHKPLNFTSDAEFLAKKGLIKYIDFTVGDLPPTADTNGYISYQVAATVPLKKSGPTFVETSDYSMSSYSLASDAIGSPGVSRTEEVRPISFNINTVPNVNTFYIPASSDPVQPPTNPTNSVTFYISFNNNGGVAALNTDVTFPLPAGTNAVSANFFDDAGNIDPSRGTIDQPSAANGFNYVFHYGTVDAYPNNGTDDPLNRGYAEVTVTLQDPLPSSLSAPNAVLAYKAVIQGAYDGTGVIAAAMRRKGANHAAIEHTAVTGPVLVGGIALPGQIRIIAAQSAQIFAWKTAPARAEIGQSFPYQIVYGNLGGVATGGIDVGIQIPFNTKLDLVDTTPGYKVAGGVVTWSLPSLSPHSAAAVTLYVTPTASNFAIVENSCYVAPDHNGTPNCLGTVPGPVVTEVTGKPLLEVAWQFFGDIMQSTSGTVLRQGPGSVQSSIDSLASGATHTSARGIDLIITGNNAIIGQLGGGQIVASGAGNIVSSGAGNIVSSGAGNIVASGAGNLITVTGVGLLTPANVFTVISGIVSSGAGNIVSSGAGNIVSSGAGNLIGNDGTTLIGQDGSAFMNGGNPVLLVPQGGGIVSSGAGNITVTGGGNIVSSGAGNIVSTNGSNIVSSGAGNLLASGNGFAIVVTAAGIVSSGAGNVIGPQISAGASALKPGEDGGAMIGSNLIGNDGSSVISNDGGSIVSSGAGN